VLPQDQSSDGRTELDGASSGPRKRKRSKRPQIETLEEFIAHAYSLRGRTVVLTEKLERALGLQGRLPTQARERLLEQSKTDVDLAATRQILIATRGITTYPALRGDLREFVGEVLSRTPILASEELQAFIRNLPGGPSLREALALVLEQGRRSGAPSAKRRAAKAKSNRGGPAYCLAVWAAETRGIPIAALSEALHSALWAPAAQRIRDDIARLRAMTELRDLAGVGAACAIFNARAADQANAALAAQRDSERALHDLEALRARVTELVDSVAERDKKIDSLNKEVQGLKAQHATTLVHASDDYERLRTRMVRRLRADLALLEDGLTAIRRVPPKNHVMDDHASRVADALRSELKQLESEG